MGQQEFESKLKSSSRNQNYIIGDAALDAVWDTWAWGAAIGTPDKVQDQLSSWRYSTDYFNLYSFIGAAIRGRAVTGIGAITFIIIQVVAFGCLFIAPALRVFFDVDIGFGQLGECSPDGCFKVF